MRPGAFVFCERESGAMRFRVDAAPGGMLPIQKAASLLAIHCLVRGHRPCDYTVLVVPQANLLGPVKRKAQGLLQAGLAIGCDVPLSPREREVLESVLRNQSNKEIAALLNVSERTVKFHVSSLLVKFNVHNRAGLMREAPVNLLPAEEPDTLFGVPISPDRRSKGMAPRETKIEVMPMPRAERVEPTLGPERTPRPELRPRRFVYLAAAKFFSISSQLVTLHQASM